jgi:hypothetical protein
MRLSEKYNFVLAWLGLGYIALVVIIGYLIYFALTPVVPPARNVFSAETLPFIWPFLAVIVPLLLWLSVGSFYVFPPLRRQVRLHRAYIQGEPATFIQPQPTSMDQGVQEIHTRVEGLPGSNLLPYLLVLCPVALLGLLGGRFPGEPVRSIIEGLVLSYVALALSVLVVLPGSLTASSLSLCADSEGLTVHNLTLNQGMMIKWRDVRIFARVGSYRRSPRLAYYELVDDKQSLIFAVALKPPSRFALVKPTTSFEEYERQTQQLLGMIAARTGLPLVDLRSR